MENKGWRHVRRIKLNKKGFARRMRKAESATTKHAHKFIVGRWENMREIRRHIIVWLAGVGLLIAVVGWQISWFQNDYTVQGSNTGGVYAEAVTGTVETLNPLYASTSAEIDASKLLFSSLFNYDQTGHLRGELAKSITVDEKGLVYTVKLREGVKWHDGYTVTAKDIVFTTDLMADPATRALSSLGNIWSRIEADQIDERTVKFTLENPNAAFPHALTFAVLPQHIIGEIEPRLLRENDFSKKPVGSGPFQFRRLQVASLDKDRTIVHMAAFKDYFKGAPKLSRFQLHTYDSVKSIMQALKTREVNAAVDVGAFNAENVNSDHYDIKIKALNSGVYAILNNKSPTLKDKAIRQALQASVNTRELRTKIGSGHLPMDLPIANRQFVTGEGVPQAAPPDVKKAAQLLDEAGWKLNKDNVRTKGGEPLKLQLVTVTLDTYEVAIKYLAEQWRKIGIDCEVLVIDPQDPTKNFTRVLQDRNYDVLISSLNIGADPDVYAYWHSSQVKSLGKNYSNYSSSISDTALAGALTKRDPAERDARYKTFVKEWLKDVPAIGLYQTNMYYVHAKGSRTITDSEVIISPTNRFARVIYWTVEHGRVYKTP